MGQKVIGTNCAFLVSHNGQFVPVSCSRSFTINVESDTVETTNAQNGIWKRYQATRLSWTVDFDGITVIDSEYTIAMMRALQHSLQTVQIAILCNDINGNRVSYLGEVLPRQISETFNHNDYVTHTASLQGSGILNISYNFTPSGGDVMRIDYTCVGGETTYTATVLQTRQVIYLSIDGIAYSLVNGIPANNKEFAFNAITGVISWSEPKDAGVQLVILYQ